MPEIKFTLTAQSRINEVDFDNIPFGKICTDHMFTADFIDGQWTNFQISPVAPLVLHPTNLALHYGQSIFEGMKASLSQDGTPLLMRPELHARRFNASAHRMCMPEFPEEEFVRAIRTLVSTDRAWIPPQRGSSLYIRPFMFATDEYIGVKPSKTYKFVIITLPAGPYYDRPVRLRTETTYVRAVDGGVGEAKCAGNYAAAMYPSALARQKGYDQVLWLDAHEFKYIQEVGTMNIFFVIGDTVVTPSTTGSILKGITRASIIEILRDKGVEVQERQISIDEVIESYRKGTLREVFGTGTAALVANVDCIRHGDIEIELSSEKWSISLMAKEEINGLRDGSIVDTRGWIVPIKEAVMA
ncbi:MAG: branched-chain amino acid aminotransferase [Saprospiraceae bacterium]|nr:branched-chain amino acid aminotransferase [Saprospiraceae bacterium]